MSFPFTVRVGYEDHARPIFGMSFLSLGFYPSFNHFISQVLDCGRPVYWLLYALHSAHRMTGSSPVWNINS
jgi:hypothetical protein